MRYALVFFLMFSAPAWGQDKVWPQDELYEAGANAGARYLSEYMGLMRLHALFTECDHPDAASAIDKMFPDSFAYALGTSAATNFTNEQKQTVAQIARAYVLGYEIGIRVNLFVDNPLGYNAVEILCEIAASAAGDIN